MSSREIVDMMLKRKKIELTASIIAKVQKNILGALHPMEKRKILSASQTNDGSYSQISCS